ncbi:hypothetical protein [Paenibacillus elgii]|uniref:hypothetical protein n=1 Tax=Paenibacillus elgii TaxID=189691 RepID=UPI000248D907|nr:hypothetical protein [Paenibacillus elgii]
MDDNGNEYSKIHEKVAKYIQGIHGRIGIIVPSNKPTYEEWVDLHNTLAEIAIKNATSTEEKEATTSA